MRIAMLHVDLPPASRGGVAHQVSRLSDALARRGHEVVVLTLSERPPDVEYDVLRLSLRGPRNSRAWRMLTIPILYGLAGYDEFDVVHAHGDSHLLLRREIPIVRTFHGSARDEARTAVRLPRRLAQRVHIAEEQIARHAATVTVGISGVTESSVGRVDRIIPCGVDLERFRPGTRSSVPSILFVGTLGGRKRGQLLVDRFLDEVRPVLPEAELWLVCEEDVRGEGIRTWRRPDDDELARLYREAWVFASPSRYEGFGVPYIEALASGTPVVAFPNDAACELLETGSGGLLADDAELGSMVIELLRDTARREELGNQGRRFSARFGWDAVATAYEWVYDLALVRRGRH